MRHTRPAAALRRTLDHEALDHTVERAALVMEWLARLADSLLASAESPEVLCSSRDEVRVELENHASCWCSANGHIEERDWTRHGGKQERKGESKQ